MTEGRSLPTTWVTISIVICMPLGSFSTAFTRERAWMREPAGTGAGSKRERRSRRAAIEGVVYLMRPAARLRASANMRGRL